MPDPVADGIHRQTRPGFFRPVVRKKPVVLKKTVRLLVHRKLLVCWMLMMLVMFQSGGQAGVLDENWKKEIA